MGITIHYEKLTDEVGIYRAYEDGKSYEARDPYFGAVVVHYHDRNTVELKSAVFHHSADKVLRLIIKDLKKSNTLILLDRHHLHSHIWSI